MCWPCRTVTGVYSRDQYSKHCWLKVCLCVSGRRNMAAWLIRLDVFLFHHSGLQVWCNVHQVLQLCVALDTSCFWHRPSLNTTLRGIFLQGCVTTGFHWITVVSFVGRFLSYVRVSLSELILVFSSVRWCTLSVFDILCCHSLPFVDICLYNNYNNIIYLRLDPWPREPPGSQEASKPEPVCERTVNNNNSDRAHKFMSIPESK